MAKNKNVPMLDGSKWSPYQIMAAANAHYELSAVVTSTASDNCSVHRHEKQTLANIGASATNRILAAELYLKALLVAIPSEFPATHDLVWLFETLPTEAQQQLVDAYDALIAIGKDVDMNWSLDVVFQNGTVPLGRPPSLLFDEALPALLARNKNGFSQWRYLFQGAK